MQNTIVEKQSVSEFKKTFFTLSPNQQKIFRYLHWFCQSHHVVKPSQRHIAETVGCSRDTVIQTIKLFIKFNWLTTIKKAWRTCIYIVSESLLNLDLDSKETFKKDPNAHLSQPPEKQEPTPNPTIDPTINPTHSKYSINYTMNVNENVAVQSTNLKETTTKTHQQLNKLPITEQDKHLLSRYNQNILLPAIRDLEVYSMKNTVRNVAAFLTSRCKAYSQPQPTEPIKIPYEIDTLPVTQRDKILLSHYNPQAFRFAHEDYKTYRIYKTVKNVAAFLTSRCKHYCKKLANGESMISSTTKQAPSNHIANKILAKETEKKINSTENSPVRLEAGSKDSKYVEILPTITCGYTQPICITYDDLNFTTKLTAALRKWNLPL